MYKKFLKIALYPIFSFIKLSPFILAGHFLYSGIDTFLDKKIESSATQFAIENKYITSRAIVAESRGEYKESLASASNHPYFVFAKICKVYFTNDTFDTSIFSDKHKDLIKEIIIFHELAHCESKEFLKTYSSFITSDTLTKDQLNYITNFLSKTRYENTLSKYYEENFADMYGAALFLKKHNYSEEAFEALDWFIEVRKIKSNRMSSKVAELSTESEDGKVKFIEGYWSHDTAEGLTQFINEIKHTHRNYYDKMSPTVLKINLYSLALDELILKINNNSSIIINLIYEMEKNKLDVKDRKDILMSLITDDNKVYKKIISEYYDKKLDGKNKKLSSLKP